MRFLPDIPYRRGHSRESLLENSRSIDFFQFWLTGWHLLSVSPALRDEGTPLRMHLWDRQWVSSSETMCIVITMLHQQRPVPHSGLPTTSRLVYRFRDRNS